MAIEPLVKGTDPEPPESGTFVPPEEPFLLHSAGLSFGPMYSPDEMEFRKSRDLTRNSNMCEGEDVSDGGGKNREIHVTGFLRQRERLIFEDIVDADHAFNLQTFGWSGEVRVDDGKYRGPVMREIGTGELLWKYTLNLVSTGKDEFDEFTDNGIVE